MTRRRSSVIADDRWDVAATYSRTLFGAHDFQAAIAYADAQGQFDQVNGSASVLLGGPLPGVNLTVAAGQRNFDEAGRNDGNFVYGKIGYLFDPFSFGSTGVAVDYYYGEDVDLDRFAGGAEHRSDRHGALCRGSQLRPESCRRKLRRRQRASGRRKGEVLMSVATMIRSMATAIVLLALAGCAGGEPLEATRIDDIPPGPGLLTGEDGEFVIYRR